MKTDEQQKLSGCIMCDILPLPLF